MRTTNSDVLSWFSGAPSPSRGRVRGDSDAQWFRGSGLDGLATGWELEVDHAEHLTDAIVIASVLRDRLACLGQIRPGLPFGLRPLISMAEQPE